MEIEVRGEFNLCLDIQIILSTDFIFKKHLEPIKNPLSLIQITMGAVKNKHGQHKKHSGR